MSWLTATTPTSAELPASSWPVPARSRTAPGRRRPDGDRRVAASGRPRRGACPTDRRGRGWKAPFWGGAICYQGSLKERVPQTATGRIELLEVVERFCGRRRAAAGADPLQKMTYLELKQRLAELLLMRVDKMTMATSVEARVPFLDHELVEFAMALPPEMKVRTGPASICSRRPWTD